MTGRRFRQAVILTVAAGAVSAAPWTVRADTSPAGKLTKKEKTVRVLVAQGEAALEVKSYASARDTFSDALTLDERNTEAVVGEALARMELDQPIPAIETIDKAADVGVPTRLVAINAAVIHMRGKDPTRAAKILKTYLSAAATPHDERAYDLFITALSQFSAQAKGNYFYNACRTFAAAYADKLAQDHPGQKLWGIDWINADEADQKISAFKTEQTAIDTANAKVNSLDSQVNAAQTRYDALENAYQNRQASRNTLHAAKDRLDALQDQEKTAQDAVDDAMAKGDQPPLLTSVDPIMPGDAAQLASVTTPPTGTGSSGNDSPRPVTPGPVTPRPATPPTPPAQVNSAPPSPVIPPKKVAVTNYAVAFAIAPNLAITDARAVRDGNSFSLQSPDGTVVQATLVRTDSTGKLALLQLGKHVAYLDLATAFNGGPVTCTGFPEVDIFNPSPAAIIGSAPAPGDDWQIKLSRHPRLGGGPLTVTGGKVVGVELATRDSAIAEIPAVSLEALRSFLGNDQPQPGHGTNKPDAAIYQLVSTSQQ